MKQGITCQPVHPRTTRIGIRAMRFGKHRVVSVPTGILLSIRFFQQ